MRLSAFADQYVSERVRPWLFLSYSVAESPVPVSRFWSRYYTSGKDDIYLFFGWCIAIVLIREILLRSFYVWTRWYLGDRFLREQLAKRPGLRLADAKAITNGSASAVDSNGHANGNGAISRSSRNGTPVDSKEAPAFPSSSDLRLQRAVTKSKQKTDRVATRFAEQGVAAVYYIVAWLFGLWVNTSMYPDGRGPLDTNAFWEYFPHTPLPGPIKAYYFLAFAFYGTQIIIIHIEKRRNDHYLMFSHHIVTVALISWSYYTHLSRPGTAILFLLDWCDIFLPIAKMMKYLGMSLAPDVTFVIWLTSWLVTRQILLLKIVLAVTFDMPVMMPLEWAPEKHHLVTYKSYVFFAVSLWLLYAFMSIWFYIACKVAYGVVKGNGAADSRSDSEDSDSTSNSTPALSRTQSKEE